MKKPTTTKIKKNTNKDTNYYIQQRYNSGELNNDKISYEPDESHSLHVDHGHESIQKKTNIEIIDNLIQRESVIKEIVDKLTPDTRTIFTIEETNKVYSFCMLQIKKNTSLENLTIIEMFDLITSYLNLSKKETEAFYRNLSITHKSTLLEALAINGLYKSNKLF